MCSDFAPNLTGFLPTFELGLCKWTIKKKTSLHLISPVSADITSGINSNITSDMGQKPRDFLFVCFSIYILWPGLS